MLGRIKDLLRAGLFYLFRIFPLQDKVVATTMRGRKYGDNPQFIIEELLRRNAHLTVVWLKNKDYVYDVPKRVKTVDYYKTIRVAFELATAKVWINTHRYENWYRKRKGQLIIETWHGGLGLKKIEGDIENFQMNEWSLSEIRNTCRLSDVFISQSDHLSAIYRRAFGYKGPIFKCGYPKNDQLFQGIEEAKENFRASHGLGQRKIVLYAPTFRDSFEREGVIDFSVYDMDFYRLADALTKRFGGEWVVMVKWHPIMLKSRHLFPEMSKDVLDVTEFQDMQGLIKAADVMISDYSSCLFDAALIGIPCFTFATDFEAYKAERGVYYEMEELPFPYARNNDELVSNILAFDDSDYQKRWKLFAERMGLNETGHASEAISEKILSFLDGKNIQWDN